MCDDYVITGFNDDYIEYYLGVTFNGIICNKDEASKDMYFTEPPEGRPFCSIEIFGVWVDVIFVLDAKPTITWSQLAGRQDHDFWLEFDSLYRFVE